MKCENCAIEYDVVLYGSGRFCSSKCARGFSTKEKRKEINKKVSEKLTGRKGNIECGFKKGYDANRKILTTKDHLNAVEKLKELWINRIHDKIKNTPFEKLSKLIKRRIILKEQNYKCLCGIDEWNGSKLVLQLDHIDGNRNNENRENLRILCPNCHSITPTYAGKNKIRIKISDEKLKEALKTYPNIHLALKSFGLHNGRNYKRAQNLVLKMGVEPTKL